VIPENLPQAKSWKKTGKVDRPSRIEIKSKTEQMVANYVSGRIDCSDLEGRIGVQQF
jgi:hypothetical protein